MFSYIRLIVCLTDGVSISHTLNGAMSDVYIGLRKGAT